jgi:uncharacterized coiled-coil protein SlyX
MNPGVPDPRGPEGPDPGSEPEASPPAASPPAASTQPAFADAPTQIVEVPADLEPSPPVQTETVDVPPVTAATVERPEGPRRVGTKWAALVGVIALLGIGTVVVLGYSMNQDLATTRTTLATTATDLGSTRTTLEDTTATLASRKTELDDKTAEKEQLVEEVRGLAAQVATQTECVQQQQAALAELIRLSDLQTENFNRTAEGSAWDTAEKKRGDNITAALDAFYAAYSQAFDGNKSGAKAQSDRGNNAQSNIAEAEAQLDAEVGLVNTKATEISALLDDLEQQLTQIETHCQETAP